MLRAGALLLALTFAAPLPALAAGYDDTWYEGDFWGGEYPDGFSVSTAVSVMIRPRPEPDLPRDVTCDLPKGAVYHPWNADRVTSDQLAFKSFTRKVAYKVRSRMSAAVSRNSDNADVTLHFAKGAKWTYLAYLGEGMFLLDFKGTIYVGDQDLIEGSVANDATDKKPDEWLRLTCANKATGWLLLRDVFGQPAIGAANIITYGEAQDLAD